MVDHLSQTLHDEAGETFDPNLTKAEVSKMIDAVQPKTGRGRNHRPLNQRDAGLWTITTLMIWSGMLWFGFCPAATGRRLQGKLRKRISADRTMAATVAHQPAIRRGWRGTHALAVNAYLAGPDVFLPNARAHAMRKIAICARHHIIGRAPLNEDVESPDTPPDAAAWRTIFRKDLAMMADCDIIIANLTPFRGPSADAGTLIEVGWFFGHGRPIFGYSNSATTFTARSGRHLAAVPDAVAGMAVEGFGLPDNLMIPGAVLDGGGNPIVLPLADQDRPFNALDVFARCVAIAAATMQCRAPSPHSPARADRRCEGGG